MVKIEKTTPAMSGQILDLLMEFRAERMTRDLWARVLNCDWGQEEDYHGLALTEDGRVVGFLGMIFSERMIRRKRHKFCSLVGWIVRPDFRNHSLSLLAPLLQMKDYTITNLTSFAGGVEIMRRIGFQVLDTESLMISAVPSFLAVPRGAGWSVTDNPAELRRILEPADRKIFEDHQPYDCRHALLSDGGANYCYVVFTERGRCGVKYGFAHYISHPSVFFDHLGCLRNHLLRKGVCMLLVDRRYAGDRRPGFSLVRVLSVPRLYRPSAGISPVLVDTLYSEWVILRR
ncbi:MAG: hypothetical protein V1929_05265 [bacterium]